MKVYLLSHVSWVFCFTLLRCQTAKPQNKKPRLFSKCINNASTNLPMVLFVLLQELKHITSQGINHKQLKILNVDLLSSFCSQNQRYLILLIFVFASTFLSFFCFNQLCVLCRYNFFFNIYLLGFTFTNILESSLIKSFVSIIHIIYVIIRLKINCFMQYFKYGFRCSKQCTTVSESFRKTIP